MDNRSKLLPRVIGSLAIVGLMIGLMIGLLIIQIVVVAALGIETNRRGLESLTAKA